MDPSLLLVYIVCLLLCTDASPLVEASLSYHHDPSHPHQFVIVAGNLKSLLQQIPYYLS